MDISSMSAATQKKNKLYLNSLKQAITLLKSNAPSSDLYKVYLGVNAARLQKNAQIVQNKYNKVPLEQDRAVAKEAYETSLKRFNDKDKFQKILVDKGNKINQEMKDINAKAIVTFYISKLSLMILRTVFSEYPYLIASVLMFVPLYSCKIHVRVFP